MAQREEAIGHTGEDGAERRMQGDEQLQWEGCVNPDGIVGMSLQEVVVDVEEGGVGSDVQVVGMIDVGGYGHVDIAGTQQNETNTGNSGVVVHTVDDDCGGDDGDGVLFVSQSGVTEEAEDEAIVVVTTDDEEETNDLIENEHEDTAMTENSDDVQLVEVKENGMITINLKCNSCFKESNEESLVTATLCEHIFCKVCLKNHLVNVALEMTMFPLPCIVCQMALDPVFCLKLFEEEHGLRILLSTYIAQMNQQYRRQLEPVEDDVQILDVVPKEGPSRRRLTSCHSCFDVVRDGTCPTLCQHTFCQPCMLTYLRILCTEKRDFPPVCPTCRTNLDRDTCLVILQANPWLKEKFEFYLIQEEHMSNLCYCANPACNTPFDWSMNENKSCSETYFRVTCPLCKTHTCVRCKQACRLDEVCAACLDSDFLSLAAENQWKRCPRCGLMISKIGGCDFVECHCGRTFDFTAVGATSTVFSGDTTIVTGFPEFMEGSG